VSFSASVTTYDGCKTQALKGRAMENRDILVTPSSRRRTEFLKAVAQSRTLHGKWASPPCTPDAFDALLKLPKENHMMFWVVTEKNALAGAINISQIVWGKFRSDLDFERKGTLRGI
jgi:hypothetical protein